MAENDVQFKIDELKNIIKKIYIETTTDHYGDAIIALEKIDEILAKSRHLWS